MSNHEKNIALIFNKPGVFPGFEEIVSAHVQLPLKTAKMLQENGNKCYVVTTSVPKNQVLSNAFKGINPGSIFFVPDLNKQGARSAALEGQVSGIKYKKIFPHLFSVSRILRDKNIDVLHVFGTKKFILLAVLYKIFFPNINLVWTTENRYKKSSKMVEFILKRFVHVVIATTEYVQSTLPFREKVTLIRPGVAREFAIKKDSIKNRALFWRDPSPENGADVAFKVFKKLALEFENIIFTFAVRPHWNSVVEKKDFNRENLEYFEYPYANGVSIDKLLSESICVLFPFRELSTNPQLAVIETLNAGIPVVCSSVESNQEILQKVGLDFNLFDDADAYEIHLRKMLNEFLGNNKLDGSKINNLAHYYNWEKYLTDCLGVYE